MEWYAGAGAGAAVFLEETVKTNERENRYDTLVELGLRPVSQVFNQIRYWSALDDPNEEKWDYVSHYTRTERREMGIASAGSFNARPLIAGVLILLLLVGVGTGGWLAWPYLKQQFSALSASGSSAQVEVVTGYMVRLGSRDLGVIQDRSAMESFVSQWLASQNAAAQPGVTYKIAQDLTYEEVRVDAPYCATLEEVENAFVKHAALDVA